MIKSPEIPDISVSTINPAELDDDLIERWRKLEPHTSAANVYLSPDFMLPALQYLVPGNSTYMIKAELPRQHNDLAAVGFIQKSKASRSIPFHHMMLFRSLHTATTGFLTHKQYTAPVLKAILNHLKEDNIQILEALNLQKDQTWKPLLNKPQPSFRWIEYERFKRYIFKPDTGGDEYLNHVMSKKNIKNNKRRHKLLQKEGKVTWKIIRGDADWEKHIDRFLYLENLGWKGARSSSLLSSSADQTFFKTMILNFARHDKVFFTELRLNDEAIASSVGLVYHKTAYGFKLAWDPQYAKSSPGILNLIEMIRSAPETLRDIDYLDSASVPGSFIESYFRDHIEIVSGTFVENNYLSLILAGIQQARLLKQKITTHQQKITYS